MFAVGVSDHVMIAHSFADPYFGPAQRLHGATYAFEIEVRSASLNEHHVVMDIGALRSIVRRALEGIDYTNLDDHEAFPGKTSTSERLAEWLATEVGREVRKLPDGAGPPEAASVRVLARESPVAWVTFERAI